MSGRQRLFNLAIAAVIAIVAAVVIITTSGDDAEPEREAASTPVPAQAEAAPRAKKTPAPKPTPEPVPSIVVRAGAVAGGMQTIEVEEGERVRFDVTSDVPEEVHVHAYDIYEDLAAGEPTRFSFPATITGIIEVELHGSGLQVAELRVEP